MRVWERGVQKDVNSRGWPNACEKPFHIGERPSLRQSAQLTRNDGGDRCQAFSLPAGAWKVLDSVALAKADWVRGQAGVEAAAIHIDHPPTSDAARVPHNFLVPVTAACGVCSTA